MASRACCACPLLVPMLPWFSVSSDLSLLSSCTGLFCQVTVYPLLVTCPLLAQWASHIVRDFLMGSGKVRLFQGQQGVLVNVQQE